MTSPRVAIIKAQREKRRQQRLNKTWRNPRFYVFLLFLPALLCVSLPLTFFRMTGDLIERAADEAEQFFIRILSPFHRWVDAGARSRGKA